MQRTTIIMTAFTLSGIACGSDSENNNRQLLAEGQLARTETQLVRSDDFVPCENQQALACTVENGKGYKHPYCRQEMVSYGPCIVSHCKQGYVLNASENTCVARGQCFPIHSQSCNVENGAGQRSVACPDSGARIVGTCLVTRCNDYYRENNNRCELVPRRYPSIFQAWGQVEGLPNNYSFEAKMAKHDMIFVAPNALNLKWATTATIAYVGLSTDLVDSHGDPTLLLARTRIERIRAINPHAKILVAVRYRDGYNLISNPGMPYSFYPETSPFWLRNASGQLVIGWAEDLNENGFIEPLETRSTLIDFTNESVQDAVAAQVAALKNTGLVDGVMFDWFKPVVTSRPYGGGPAILTEAQETNARVAILQKVRALVGENFLIIGNSNYRKVEPFAPYMNGVFMEAYKDKDEVYTTEELMKLESTLLWAENNLQEPIINGLEGWRVAYPGEPQSQRVTQRNSDANLQAMRMITTLSLTHSDGYSLFADPNQLPEPDHAHHWYDFYNHDLGTPSSEKGQLVYLGHDGLFIREFSLGYAVYNRGDSRAEYAFGAQEVKFAERVRSVTTGRVGKMHRVAARDGDLFIKTP